MSMDKGLKAASALVRHRNVLSRDERIEALKEEERFADGQSVLGLPKVANRKVAIKKEKAEKPGEGVVAEGAEATAAAAAAPADEKKADKKADKK